MYSIAGIDLVSMCLSSLQAEQRLLELDLENMLLSSRIAAMKGDQTTADRLQEDYTDLAKLRRCAPLASATPRCHLKHLVVIEPCSNAWKYFEAGLMFYYLAA
jgi:hypothetical protein